jgi:small-conductance mechanosensitive channel
MRPPRRKGIQTRRRARAGRNPRARRARGRRGARRGAGATGRAQAGLRGFRQATILAVAITALMVMVLAPEGDAAAPTQEPQTGQAEEGELPDTVAIIEEVAVEDLQVEPEVADPDTVPAAALGEARETIQELWVTFLGNLPRLGVVLGVFLLAWVIVAVARPLLRRAVRGWDRGHAAVILFSLSVWLLAIGIAVSVLAGDVRALIGSIGLVGLALSWALQTPIESFSGWLLNSFRGYYRVGDRVAVGEVYGDVYRIDALTTTVWEYGGTDREVSVAAEQPTGRLITFPNSEILAGSIVNYTRDFPYVWDEIAVPVGNRSDLVYAQRVIGGVAREVLGDVMVEPAARYEEILRGARLETEVSREPQTFVDFDDSWTNVVVRYLVPARERRKWKSLLTERIAAETNRPEHDGRIISVTPRRQVQFVDPDGMPYALTSGDGGETVDRQGDGREVRDS